MRRTFGVALGHTLVAWTSLSRGLERIQANEARMQQELEAHWDTVAEGAQTILRAAGVQPPMSSSNELTRGRRITQADYAAWVAQLNVGEPVRAVSVHSLR